MVFFGLGLDSDSTSPRLGCLGVYKGGLDYSSGMMFKVESLYTDLGSLIDLDAVDQGHASGHLDFTASLQPFHLKEVGNRE